MMKALSRRLPRKSRSDGRFYPWVTMPCSCDGCGQDAVSELGTAASHPDGVYLCWSHVSQLRERYPDEPMPELWAWQMPWPVFWRRTWEHPFCVMAKPAVRLVSRMTGREPTFAGMWFG